MRLNFRDRFLIPTISIILLGMSVLTTISYITSKNYLEKSISEQIVHLCESSQKITEFWIYIASADQAQGIEHINVSVAELDKIVQQNAESAEIAASSSEAMNKQVQKVKALIDELLSVMS